jgi:hypothetical protein
MVLRVSLERLFGSRTATTVDDAIDDATAAQLRAKLTGWSRYTLLDRGSYEFLDAVDVPPSIVERASQIAGRALAVADARALRLVPGDYILAHHDRLHDDLPIELVLDLSIAPVPAEIHYRRRGHVFFRAPCAPRSLTIVERGPTVTRNHTYVSKLHGGAEVLRLVVLTRGVS